MNTVDTLSVRGRLSQLPRKLNQAFSDLLDKEYLNEEILETILDAGELAGDTNKLLGFAIGFVNLRQTGVPIKDVVSMSKILGRPVRLDWSVARWKNEHARLSRAVALFELSSNFTEYDLSDFEPLLPAKFPGYIIRNSRQLGREGLRQRHCVASYGHLLENKRCALATVFYKKQRWTVQLNPSRREDTPLLIAQIRSALNQPPNEEVTNFIYELFGVSREPHGRVVVQSERNPRFYHQNLQAILPVLQANGVNTVDVHFSGYGDSGQIESVTFQPAIPPDVHPTVQIMRVNSFFQDGQWVNERVAVQEDLTQAIETLTYDYLSEVASGIENNDGGYADLQIDVENETFLFDVNYHYTETSQHFCAERHIASGEDV